MLNYLNELKKVSEENGPRSTKFPFSYSVVYNYF
jgi:hypothetical protein